MGRAREEKKKDQRRERVRRKKMQVREKVGKSRNIVLFQWSAAPEGRKVGSLKRRVRSHLAKWEVKNSRRCSAKHIGSQNVQNTSCSDDFWKLRCRKSARRYGAKHISKSKCTLHYSTLRFTLLHYVQLHHTTLQLQLQLRYTTLITLHYTNYITLHYTTLHYTNYNQNYSFNYNYTTLQ